MQNSVKRFLKNVRVINGKIIDDRGEEAVPFYSNSDPAGFSSIPFGNPISFVNHPRYIVETQEGTESFPRSGHEFEKGEEVRIVETCYCCLLTSKKLEKKS